MKNSYVSEFLISKPLILNIVAKGICHVYNNDKLYEIWTFLMLNIPLKV